MANEISSGNRAVLFDMHCHLDFVENKADFETLASRCGVNSLSNTVSPEDYARLKPAFENAAYARLALGAHPWWIADGRIGEESLALFEQLAVDAQFIGEIGLDLTGHRAEDEEAKAVQTAALERILKAAGEGKLISLHGSGAEKELLDILEKTGTAASCDCILHWYAGPSDQLQRAIELGCYFSVGRRMLKTKRGREYARIIPTELLLLESDMPSRDHTNYSPSQWNADLTEALLDIAEIRGVGTTCILEAMDATSEGLLNR